MLQLYVYSLPNIYCACAEMPELMSLVSCLAPRVNCGLELKIDLVFCGKNLFDIIYWELTKL